MDDSDRPIKRPTSIFAKLRRVDKKNDLWNIYYEETFDKEHEHLAEKSVEIISRIIPAKLDKKKRKITIDVKKAKRRVVFDMLVGEILLQSSLGDISLIDILGIVTASKIMFSSPEQLDALKKNRFGSDAEFYPPVMNSEMHEIELGVDDDDERTFEQGIRVSKAGRKESS